MTAPVPDEQAASDTRSRFGALRNWVAKLANGSAYWSLLIGMLGWSIVSPKSWWNLAFVIPAVLLAEYATGLIKMHSSRNARLRAELARVQEEANSSIRKLAAEKQTLRAGFDKLGERAAHLGNVLAGDINCTQCWDFLSRGKGAPCDEAADPEGRISAALGVS